MKCRRADGANDEFVPGEPLHDGHPAGAAAYFDLEVGESIFLATADLIAIEGDGLVVGQVEIVDVDREIGRASCRERV